MEHINFPFSNVLKVYALHEMNQHDEPTVRIYLKQEKDDDGNEIEANVNCASLEIKKDDTGSVLYVDSIKATDELLIESMHCSISGNVLMSWIVNFIRMNKFDEAYLFDAADVNMGGRRYTNLTRFRKMSQKSGMGWYESFGFTPLHQKDEERYQDGFDRLRNAAFDDVCTFLVGIYAFLTSTHSISNAIFVQQPKNWSHNRHSKQWSEVFTRLNPSMDMPACLKTKVLYMQSVPWPKETVSDLESFFSLYGVSFYSYNAINKYIENGFHPTQKKMFIRNFRPANGKTFRSVCFPANVRRHIDRLITIGAFRQTDVSKDFSAYINAVECALEICTHAGILYIPEKLHYKFN